MLREFVKDGLLIVNRTSKPFIYTWVGEDEPQS